MRWDPAAVLGAFEAPPGTALVHAAPADVPELIAFFHETFPELAVGSAARYLDAAFYAEQVHLAGTDPARPFVALLARHEGHVVAAVTLEKHDTTLSGGVGAVAVAHRSLLLGLLGPRLLEAFGRAMGAELVHYYATLRTRHQQVIAERLGFTAVGIMPASDRDLDETGAVRRTFEVLYAKVLAAPELVQGPSLDAMTPRTRALYRQIFE